MTVLAYDADGVVIATLDGVWDGPRPVDLPGYEADGGKLRRYWEVSGAVGSGTWPDRLGAEAHQYRVVLDPAAPHRIVALVHRQTGERLDRDPVASP